MTKIAIIGAGKIGRAIASMLEATGDYRVTVADRSAEQLARMGERGSIETREVDVADGASLDSLLQGHFAVISALPYDLTVPVAQAAARCKVHYLDLTEDVASTQAVKALGADSERAFIPQCGLAPGFVSIVAADLARRLDTLDALRLRVGALPQFPSNALNYNLTWSTDGVINEYCEPCEAIVNGKRTLVAPLEEREEFSLDGITYEAFNTSGGLGSLCETLEGRVRTLNYRTIRYPGHAAIMRALLHDLRLAERRDVLKDIFEKALPATLQDVVVVFVTATGERKGQFVQETYANKIYSRTVGGEVQSAIQVTTSAGVCAILDLLAEGALPQKGFVRPEQVPLERFLANRFGRVYARAEDIAHAA
ncbi:saccharopine dehydrogenase family protein [Kaustia mangrovi]|uniref:Saccharopine dehydrogenase family protein n=1 Tax=Kaustia mangrovi TaxID=2593653 RepID=A0A7S8C3M9_9HYPH|nr:saccharopine dehydrogenase family protein [Kaustia mangrovi]QPC42712.1 saccharopine dehydrogenase family protein [Kaustia mangrovi]